MHAPDNPGTGVAFIILYKLHVFQAFQTVGVYEVCFTVRFRKIATVVLESCEFKHFDFLERQAADIENFQGICLLELEGKVKSNVS